MEITQLLAFFKNGEYEKVITNTTKTTDIDQLFLRAISFALINNYPEAIKVLNDNENILKENMAKLIDVHMDICFWSNRLVDASNALKHYEEYPYISQEVEEKFIFYKKDIEKRVNALGKANYSEDEIFELLKSDNPEKLQLAFSELKKYEIEPYIIPLKRILESDLDSSTRCLALILLYEKKYDKPVNYNWHGEIIELIPSKATTPFRDVKFNKLLARKNEAKDIAYSSTFETLLATYYLYMYPKTVDDDVDDLFVAFDLVTRKFLGMGQNKMRQKPSVERLMEAIETANRLF